MYSSHTLCLYLREMKHEVVVEHSLVLVTIAVEDSARMHSILPEVVGIEAAIGRQGRGGEGRGGEGRGGEGR